MVYETKTELLIKTIQYEVSELKYIKNKQTLLTKCKLLQILINNLQDVLHENGK